MMNAGIVHYAIYQDMGNLMREYQLTTLYSKTAEISLLSLIPQQWYWQQYHLWLVKLHPKPSVHEKIPLALQLLSPFASTIAAPTGPFVLQKFVKKA